MSGGVTAGTFYDSGTINVAVSGVTAQTTWGQGSTASGLAATLATLLNATEGSTGFFTASASGGTITINSTGSGPDDDWAITTNQTETNPTYFSTPTIIATGTNGSGGAINNTNLLYGFNIPDVGGYALNGNLLTATDTVMGQWNYAYDNLNRLITASAPSTQPSGVQAYYAGVNVGATAPTWAYDPFGNRTSETWTGVGSALVPTTSAVVFAAASNQTSTFNGTAYQHDAAGDVTYDGLNSYLYDAEGRLCAVKNQSGAMTGYVYDAGGIRVAKAALTSFSCNFASNGFPSTTSWTGTSWVLGPGSEQVTEYSVSAGASTWQHTNVFASGALLASYKGTDTYFALNDWLGTKRVELNATNTCETGFRSLQFGDGYASFALSSSLPACVDATEQHFTGKERDTESGNDYFEARYYGSSMGRFTSPDPLPWISWQGGDKDERARFADYIGIPQNFNLYVYVRNNPLIYTDPTGETIYAIFYTTGNLKNNPDGGDDEFKRAAETRANEIRNSKGFDSSKDAVVTFGVNSKQDFKDAIATIGSMGQYFGKVGELSMFSHSGHDGPVFPGSPGSSASDRQFISNFAGTTMTDRSQLADLHINWESNARAVFYGCHSQSFADAFSVVQGVRTFGFTGTASFFSTPHGWGDLPANPKANRSSSYTGPLYMSNHWPWTN